MPKKVYRPPRLPDGVAWIVGGVGGFVLFVLLYLTDFLDAYTAAGTSLFVALAVGIGLNVWDEKARYYKRAYVELDKCEHIINEIFPLIKKLNGMGVHEHTLVGDLLSTICRKAKSLIDEFEEKLTDDLLSSYTSMGIALRNVLDAADNYVDLATSFSLDQTGKSAMEEALVSLKSMSEWMDTVDQELHAGSRINLTALNKQMRAYKYRTL